MITVRPVIIDASIAYAVPCSIGKSQWEILHMDADHAHSWRFRSIGDESAAKLADPSLTDVEAFLSVDVLFSHDVHPPHGHFQWNKPDIPKRLYIHPDTKDTYYMQGSYGQFIKGTRVRPKRVTRKKRPYYIDPRDGSLVHSTAFRLIDRAQELRDHKESIKNGWAQKGSQPRRIKADLVVGDEEFKSVDFAYSWDDNEGRVAFDLEFNKVPVRISKETVNALYDLNWKATAITNFSTIMDMLAEDGA